MNLLLLCLLGFLALMLLANGHRIADYVRTRGGKKPYRHLLIGPFPGAACGKPITASTVTDDPEAVTCPRCRGSYSWRFAAAEHSSEREGPVGLAERSRREYRAALALLLWISNDPNRGGVLKGYEYAAGRHIAREIERRRSDYVVPQPDRASAARELEHWHGEHGDLLTGHEMALYDDLAASVRGDKRARRRLSRWYEAGAPNTYP